MWVLISAYVLGSRLGICFLKNRIHKVSLFTVEKHEDKRCSIIYQGNEVSK
jgi:hypothetical protein